MSFDVGSLVRARGREWVVLPQADPKHDDLTLRPLDGRGDEVSGICEGVEKVEAAAFSLPVVLPGTAHRLGGRLQLVVDDYLTTLHPRLDEIAHRRAEALLADHRRVRPAAGTERDPLRVRAHLLPDVLGIFLCFPVPGARSAGGEP